MSTPRPRLPAIVAGTVHHLRRQPIRHTVRMRSYLWLIDVDDVPAQRFWRRFLPSDHFSGDGRSLRAAVTGFAQAHGETVRRDDRIVMLAAPRSVGHVFNPLSVFWCLAPDGAVRFAVLEIHNTYAQRHAHLVHPDEQGRARVTKDFYVSPFFTVDGEYRVRLRLDPQRVGVDIVLQQEGGTVFSAAFSGVPHPASGRVRALATLRTPLVGVQTSARIKAHGIALWLRRLPVVPRPTHTPPAGMR